MDPDQPDEPAAQLDQPTKDFYLCALDLLDHAQVPYVVAGAYALACHAQIVRHTKDLDVFLKRADVRRAMNAFERAGFRAERTHPHWLAKAFDQRDDAFVDMIFRSANGLCEVDDDWLARGVPGHVLGRPTRICPAEEMIWSKSFVMARERFDGADIYHILRARGKELDWDRLLQRFDGYEQLLLAHLMMYRFVYPSKPEHVPDDVIDRLHARIRLPIPARDKVCRGTLLSWDQYEPDLRRWGYEDARLQPYGNLTHDEIDQWTRAPK
ncbi:MAG TPA: nucleotidyltransferase family protein [Tepidisphaeraceae bacterium]|jgi:hypothetical protein